MDGVAWPLQALQLPLQWKSRAGEEQVQIGKKPGEAAQRRVLAEQVQPSSMGVD